MTKEQRMQRIRHILICGGILLVLYYLAPIVGMAVGGAKGEAFLISGLIHFAYPLYVYVSAVALGIKHGFCSIYAVASAVLFLPTLLIYFTANLWVAALIYGGIALIGNLMGFGLHVLLKTK